MRQTSRAVALLLVLESAQAVNTEATATSATNFNNFGTVTPLAASTTALTSRTAQWNNNGALATAGTMAASGVLTWSTPVANQVQSAKVANAAAVQLAGTSTPCVACIAGGGVWCSRTYSYSFTGTTNYQVGTTTANTGFMTANYPASGSTTSGTADNGACCAAALTGFDAFVATKAAVVDYTGGSGAQAMTDQACPAVIEDTAPVYNASTGMKWGKYKLNLATTVLYKGWWCSNGLFNQATSNTNSSSNGLQMFANAQKAISGNTVATNARQEIATVGCPQRSKACGTNTLVDLDGSPTLDITMLSTLKNDNTANDGVFMSPNDKCTWVAKSVKYAPSFTIAKGATYGLVTNAWQLHQMEYTTASSWDATQGSLKLQQTDGYYATDESVNMGNYVPLFNMPAAQFSTLRTWYGNGFGVTASTPLANEQASWYAPGNNQYTNAIATTNIDAASGTQMWGNVGNFPGAKWGTSTNGTTAITAGATFGTVGTSSSFDLRQIRFLPAQVPTLVWTNGKAVQDKYAAALTAYNTAKTTWDAYVAILEKNSKQDAFAAAFSPPKAPTVPPLPNMPWVPAAYAGYVKQTADQAGAQIHNSSQTLLLEAAQPTGATVFASLAAAQTIGGWGSFTAQTFTFRNGWGKSFGTIGYSGDTNKLALGQVWNYKWMCTTSTSAYTAGQICDASYTYSGVSATTGTAGATAVNAVPMISVVTLWALGNAGSQVTTTGAGTWNGKQDFKLTFGKSSWSNGFAALTALAAPTQPVAAKSLSGLAGAQALAASTAAALAAAAALY